MENKEKRKNKKGELTAYRFRVYNGYDVNGKQMVQFRTWVPPEALTPKQAEKEAQRLAVLFEEECAHGQVTAAVKFQKLCEQWFSEYAELNHRSTTLQREHLLASRIYPALGHLRIDKITARDIQKFINSLAKPGANKRNGKPLSRKTVVHHLNFISDIFAYAIKMDMLSDNPCRRVTVPKGESKEKEIYTIDEVKQIIQKIDSEPLKWKLLRKDMMTMGMMRMQLRKKMIPHT